MNYPAGVTGREFHIAGYDHEEETYRECGEQGVMICSFTHDAAIEITRITSLLEGIAKGSVSPAAATGLAASLSYLSTWRVERVEIETCPFKGDVTIGWYKGNGTWTCPLCQTERTEYAEEV